MDKVTLEKKEQNEDTLPQKIHTIIEKAPTTSKVAWVSKFILSTLVKVFAVYFSLTVIIILRLVIFAVSMPFTGILPYPKGDPQRSIFKTLKSIFNIRNK